MAKKKEWKEGEIALAFGLQKIEVTYTPLLEAWLTIELPQLAGTDLGIFERIVKNAHKITTWSEEDLKMKFISYVLGLANLTDDEDFVSFFDKKLMAKVNNYNLSVVTDFVVASGLMDYMKKPYFHFQEYKPSKNPKGDSMAQLLEAFLIAQSKNQDDMPLYGCEVVGKDWRFITMENKTYCVSKAYDATQEEELLEIIAILRKFRTILETELMVKYGV